MKEHKCYRIPAVGRLVQGDLYTPREPNDEYGGEKFYKSGSRKGEPRKDYFFAVAFKKGLEHDWPATEWGRVIVSIAMESWEEHICARPNFAWKVVDGDSTLPNSKNRKPCDQDGFAGHWVLKFSTGDAFPPKICDIEGRPLEDGFIRLGDYVEILTAIKTNFPSQTPGIFLNPIAVAFRDRGIRIESSSIDLANVGFGSAPMPVNAALVRDEPVATFDVEMPQPYTPILTPSAPALAPAPAPSVPKMTAAAGAFTYEQYRASGWSDEQLIAKGYME